MGISSGVRALDLNGFVNGLASLAPMCTKEVGAARPSTEIRKVNPVEHW